jgi:hypothetical protein
MDIRQFLHYNLCMAWFEDCRLYTVIQLESEVGMRGEPGEERKLDQLN